MASNSFSSPSSNYQIILPLLILFLSNPKASSDKTTQDLINYICYQMEEFGFCSKTFNENLPSPSTNIVGLTKITIDQALKNATNTYKFIENLLKNTTNPAVKNALIVCEKGYKIVKHSFQKASREFEGQDYENTEKSEQGTPRAQGSCETSFEIPPYPSNPLVERNRQIRILIAMALVTADLLEYN